jgi:predicted regulator of Ras-like GTPase activity (Roadblock/LC7/MglB family)
MKAVRELLNRESDWCKGVYAVDKDGVPVRARSRRAVRRCLVGAVRAAYGDGTPEAEAAIERMVTAIGMVLDTHEEVSRALAAWNDDSTFDDVREVIERADV